MFRRTTFGLATLSLALGAPIAAQTTITLEGRVVGPEGRPIAGAQVAVVNIAATERRNATTGALGDFRFLGLFSGTYTVDVRAIGYKPVTDSVQLVIGQRARLTMTLERGVTEIQGVSITAERVRQVEVQRLSISSPVLKEEIENLPLNSRGVMNLAAIAPGVKAYAPQQGRALPSAGGAPDLRFINLYMDGVEMKSLFNGNLVGIPQTGSPLPQEALEEFRVYLNPYDAEYSRAGSYVISAVSRRGTDRWQGSAFGYLQSKDFIARTFIQRNNNTPAPDFGRNQYGLNLRGPLSKGNLYFAGSYEGTLTDNFIDVVPTTAAWSQFRGTLKAPQKNHTVFSRLTATPNEENTVDFMWSTRILDGEGNFGGRVSRDGGISQEYLIHTGQLRHRWLATTNLVNEFSLQYVQWDHTEAPLIPGPQKTYPGIIFGTAGFPLELREKHYRIVNRSTYNLENWGGSHLVKFGAELARIAASQFLPNNRDGAFTFTTDTATNPSQASVAIGFSNPTGTDDARAEATGYTTGFYVNDEWRPAANLTINLGLRYDAELNTLNNDYTVPWASDARLTSLPQLNGFLNRGDRKNDLNNLSPRVSFSWDPAEQQPHVYSRRLRHPVRPRDVVHRLPGAAELRVAHIQLREPGHHRRERAAAARGIRRRERRRATRAREEPDAHAGEQANVARHRAPVHRRVRRECRLRAARHPQSVRALEPELCRSLDESTGADERVRRHHPVGRLRQGEVQRSPHVSHVQCRRFSIGPRYTLGFYDSEFDGNLAPVFPLRSSYDMQPTSGDERHRVVLSGLTRIPLGFQFSGIATLASPRPFPVTDGRDINNNVVTFDDFPNGERTQRPAGKWKNWYRTVDVRLQRSLFVRGPQKLTVLAEVFNVFNTDNISTFGGQQFQANNNPIPTFSQPTGAFAARQAQVGLRVDW